MKKLIILIVLNTMVLSGCAKEISTTIITKGNNPINSYQELEDTADLKVRVKVLDKLSEENSTLFINVENEVEFFHSKRKVRVVEDYMHKGEDDSVMTIESIYHFEAIQDKTRYVTDNIRSLEMNKEYIVFLIYDEQLNGYTTLESEAAIFSLDPMDSKVNEGEMECADLITLLSTDKSVSPSDLALIKSAKQIETPITIEKSKIYSVVLGNIEYVFSYGNIDEDRYLLEFKNKQYELSGPISLFE